MVSYCLFVPESVANHNTKTRDLSDLPHCEPKCGDVCGHGHTTCTVAHLPADPAHCRDDRLGGSHCEAGQHGGQHHAPGHDALAEHYTGVTDAAVQHCCTRGARGRHASDQWPRDRLPGRIHSATCVYLDYPVAHHTRAPSGLAPNANAGGNERLGARLSIGRFRHPLGAVLLANGPGGRSSTITGTPSDRAGRYPSNAQTEKPLPPG